MQTMKDNGSGQMEVTGTLKTGYLTNLMEDETKISLPQIKERVEDGGISQGMSIIPLYAGCIEICDEKSIPIDN